MHLDLERLHRYADGELATDDVASVRAHLAECGQCAERVRKVREAQHDLMRVLATVSHAPPAVTSASVIARARGRRSPGLRRAAGIALALAVAGAAYAAPGSPLRHWLSGVADRGKQASPAAVRSPEQVASQQSQPVGMAGIAVELGASLIIQFVNSQAVGTLHVRLTDSSDVKILAPRGAASFGSAEDKLIVGNTSSSGSFEVALPRSARWVEIRVGDRRVLLMDAGRVVADARPDASGHYAISLADTRP
jgi:hypothetical protein